MYKTLFFESKFKEGDLTLDDIGMSKTLSARDRRFKEVRR
jgi:hypothetical protein